MGFSLQSILEPLMELFDLPLSLSISLTFLLKRSIASLYNVLFMMYGCHTKDRDHYFTKAHLCV